MQSVATQSTLPNADALVLHNIRIWREMGYPDHFIASSMMEPALKTPAQYERWGLKWSGDVKPGRRPRRRRSRATSKPGPKPRCTLEQAMVAVEAAIAAPGLVTMVDIKAQFRVGDGVLNRYRQQYPEFADAVNRLQAKNKPVIVESRFRQKREKIAAAFAKADEVMAKAISENQTLRMSDLSRRMGCDRMWLSRRLNAGDRRAIAIKQRIDEHNKRPGLKPDPSAAHRLRQLKIPKTMATPETVLAAINKALASPGTTPGSQLVSELKIARRTLNRLRRENPDLEQAYQQLVAKNRREGSRHPSRQLSTTADMAKVETLLTQAIEENRPVTVKAICAAAGHDRGWLTKKAKNGDERAAAIIDAIKKHNRSFK